MEWANSHFWKLSALSKIPHLGNIKSASVETPENCKLFMWLFISLSHNDKGMTEVVWLLERSSTPHTLPTISKKEQDIFFFWFKNLWMIICKVWWWRRYVSHEKNRNKLRHVAQQLRFATNTLCGLSLLPLTVCMMLTVVFNCEFYTNAFIEVSF